MKNMKLSASNKHGRTLSTETMDNATAGNVAMSEMEMGRGTGTEKSAKQRFPRKLLLKQRRNFISAASSATDTENELHNQQQQEQQTPSANKQRRKTLNRQRDLLNLQSNLSPKYIGFANANSPTTITYDSDDKMRATRRRTNTPAGNSSSCELQAIDRDSDSVATVAAAAASPKLITQLLQGGVYLSPSPIDKQSVTYLSPIDKLLIKNGANSPNSTGFEADAEDVVQPTRKQLKRKLKRGQKPKTKDNNTEREQEIENNKPELESKLGNDNPQLEHGLKNDKPELEQGLEKDKTELEQELDNDKSELKQELEKDKPELEIKQELSDAVETCQFSQQTESKSKQLDTIFALPAASSTELESLKSSTEQEALKFSTELDAIKSPTELDTLKSSTELEALKSLRELDALKSPTKLEALKSPTELEALKSSMQLEQVQSPTELEAVQSPTELEAVQSPTELEAVQSPTELEAVQSPTELETLKSSTEIERFKSSPVLMEQMKSPSDLMELEPANNSDQSIKSPSSISIDSAKGSSIVTDSGWPTYQVGDLYWGKLFTYCYWPCMICPDQLGQIVGNPQTHPQRNSTDSVSAAAAALPIQVHVRFFADNGRHNWIKSENLLPFAGLKAFEDLREEVRIKHGPKSVKYRQMVAKKSKLLVWRQAIDEALIVGQQPYGDRLEKFYEIYESTILLNKEKRKRTKSMMHETSDMGSSLCDSTDNLLAKTQAAQLVLAIKRERSTSPFSPAFSPVKHNHQKRAKRRKLSDNIEVSVGTTPPPKDEIQVPPDFINYKNPEFGQLFDAIKEYVMVHRQEEKVEKVLLAVVRNIWSLKQLQLRELERDGSDEKTELLGSARLEPQRSRGVGTIKRLSNRLKTMTVHRSTTPVVTTPSTITTALESSLPTQTQTDQQTELKIKKPLGRPIDEVVQDILQLDRKYLFRGLNREPVCKYCFKPGGAIERCARSCHSWLHVACLPQQTKAIEAATKSLELALPQHITGDAAESKSQKPPIICVECASGKAQACCICQQLQLPDTSQEEQLPASTHQLIQCSQPMCNKRFHATCCKYWPQANISQASSRCPMHVCHTCVSDDPSGKYQQLGSAKLIKCVKCPATYHQDSGCIPAGSRLITTTHLICPRHNTAKADANLNVLWCYICVRGGELVCCETCPIAVHAHCRNIPIKTNESYICEECESGRLPLYGEIVWAKFNNFRWWPAIILPPTEIPSNILKKSHGLNDFVVRFFGTNDHGWITRRRVYLYIEGDTGDGYKSKSLISKRYEAGVEEATRFLKLIKGKRQELAIAQFNANKLHPPPYIKIKANKPVPPVRFVYNEEDVNICECKAGSENPCGPESGCLNRMLYHECNPNLCQAGKECENQLFELRKSPRLDVVYMNERGFGLVSREPIHEGDFVIEYVGEVINHAEFQLRMSQKTNDRDENFYFLGVEKDFIIDAGPKGNLARFMNHSCEPNCATQKWTVNCINRVGLFAIKDIPENTELTFNYLWDDLMNNGKKACYCGAKRCSGEIGGKLKDEETKETNTNASKGKTNSKLKQMQRNNNNKAIRIHVTTAKKKAVKKTKSKSNSLDNEPTQLEASIKD